MTDVPVVSPAPVIEKWRWWNALIGNPAGYLADGLPIDRIEIGLPRRQILSFGPAWMRGWEITFFGSLMLFALSFKMLRRVE